jgi:hypothetical protein
LPLLVVLCLLASFLRGSRLGIHLDNLSVVLFATILVPPLTLWTVRQFSHYKNAPDAASGFRSTRERYKSVLVFALVLILIAAAAAELRHYNSNSRKTERVSPSIDSSMHDPRD